MKDRLAFFAVFGGVGLLCLMLLAIFAYGALSTSVNTQAPVTIEVSRGESLTSLAHRLYGDGVLRNPRFFRILAILRGDATRIKAGEYVLTGEESPNDLLDFLMSGKARFVALTIPEGFSIRDVARRLDKLGLAEENRFLQLAQDPQIAAEFRLPFANPITTLEGFVFPETYFFHRGLAVKQLLGQMVAQYKKQAHDLVSANAAKVGLSPYEVVILGSIIEKETGLASERRLISAVFHNRLKAKMRLGSDPTVIYGIPAFDGNLTRAHLRADSAYNTYRNLGLPPTPIASPGLESLKAAVNPADVAYLYFVAKGDGSHFFSKDLKTHNKAVWKYQKRRHRRRQS